MTSRRSTYCLSMFLASAAILGSAWPSDAFPYFARRYDENCSACHSVVPKLNETGETFRARGYRLERPTRRTIPFAGGFAARYENRASEGFDDAYLKVVKVATGGPIGERASFVVKWQALDRKLNRRGRLEDHSGVFEDLFLNIDLDEDLRLTVGQFRVFNQFDASRQLSASLPVALAMAVPGDDADIHRLTALRGFSPAQRAPAVMLSYHSASRDADRQIDGLYLHGSIPFSGEFSLPSTERALTEVPFVVEPRPEGLFLEGYHRVGLRTIGGSAFVDTGRQMYTGMFSIDPGPWATSLVYSQALFDGQRARGVSWWGEYRPSRRTKVGLRLDDPGGHIGATVYADRQWFTERAMFWLLLEQRLVRDAVQTIAQVKLVF